MLRGILLGLLMEAFKDYGHITKHRNDDFAKQGESKFTGLRGKKMPGVMLE